MLEQNFTLAFLFDGWTLKQKKKNRLTTRVLMQTNTFFQLLLITPLHQNYCLKHSFSCQKKTAFIFSWICLLSNVCLQYMYVCAVQKESQNKWLI